MTTPSPLPGGKRNGVRYALAALLVGGAAAVAVLVQGAFFPTPPSARAPGRPPRPPGAGRFAGPALLAQGGKASVWWDVLPADLQAATVPSGAASNMHPADYVGPQACRECHPGNYKSWSQHPHRWMNALADEATVKGDFASAEMSYRGGRATFTREAGRYLMRLERGRVRRTYAIHQTIGSRFFQYYVGKQIEGPEPEGRPFSGKDHVLPFGYWLDRRAWVPSVHIGPETADADRPDPYDPPDHGGYYAVYATSCNYCHTTFPLGDMLGRRPDLVGRQAPRALHWSMRPYLEEAHPDVLAALAVPGGGALRNPMTEWEAPEHAATLGVSCEACHLGCREHVQSGGRVRPKFFPSSPHLAVEDRGARLEERGARAAGLDPRSSSRAPRQQGPDRGLDFGRTHDNVNWACGRCHIGNRPQFAAGMSTWNSVEYSDAMRGSCYSRLRCIDCHKPHQATGPRWSASADQDDAVCLKCHSHFEPAAARLAHTHHPAGSEGARCLNCHMPRLNEGIADVVRTHMIYSPTRADMIEAGHPNACNLCHTDRSIDWTLRGLKEWYGKTCDESAVARHYPDRAGPAVLGWLRSDNPSVRLVAADALARSGDARALPRLLDALDDPYLINRQFATHRLEGLLRLRLDDLGYRFYMMADERRPPLAALRTRLGGATPKPLPKDATSDPPK